MKYQIKKVNRWAYIIPKPSKEVEAKLVEKLSYLKQGAQYTPFPRVNLYYPKKDRFPFGLLKLVKELFTENNIEYEIENDNKPYYNIDKFINPDLYDYQKVIVKEAINEDNCIISASVGAGKTLMAKEIIQQLGVKTLITAPTLEIKKQWEDELRELDDVDIMTYQSAKAKWRTKRIELKDYKLYIPDECHIATIKTLHEIAMRCDNAQIIGLSGTPFRSDGNDMKMYACLGYPIKNSVRIKHLIDWGYLVDFNIESVDIIGVDTRYLTYNEIYDKQITNNDNRNKILVSKIKNSESPVLVMIDKIEHGENLAKLFKDGEYILYNGQMNKIERVDEFRNIKAGKYKYIISTKVLNEGVNLPILKTLVYAGSSKSSVRIVQQLGRVLRKTTGKGTVKVIHFNDNCKYLKKHFKERKEVLEYESR